MQEVFVRHQLPVLVYHSNRSEVVAVIESVDASAHDVESFSVLDNVVIARALVQLLLFFDREEPSHDQVLVLCSALRQDVVLGIFFEFIFDFLNYVHQVRLV